MKYAIVLLVVSFFFPNCHMSDYKLNGKDTELFQMISFSDSVKFEKVNKGYCLEVYNSKISKQQGRKLIASTISVKIFEIISKLRSDLPMRNGICIKFSSNYEEEYFYKYGEIFKFQDVFSITNELINISDTSLIKNYFSSNADSSKVLEVEVKELFQGECIMSLIGYEVDNSNESLLQFIQISRPDDVNILRILEYDYSTYKLKDIKPIGAL